MEADPLFHVKRQFYQASYKGALIYSLPCSLGIWQPVTEAAAEKHQKDHTSLKDSDPESIQRALYAARSHLALSPPSTSSAISILSTHLEASLAAKAVTALANYVAGSDKSTRVDEVRDLVIETEGAEDDGEGSRNAEESVVRVAAATIFILEGENEEAVATLTEGSAKEDLECMALLVQLLLSLDRKDLAQSTYNSAKRIGNDSALVQAMEAWIGLKTGSRPLHQSYYYYEELFQLPSGRTFPVLASHAAAHLLLGHQDEAKADIREAFSRPGGDQDGDVLAVAASLGMDGAAEKLSSAASSHPYAVDLAAKSSAFDEAASKFSITA